MTKFIWLFAEQDIYQTLVTAEVVKLRCWESDKKGKSDKQFVFLFNLNSEFPKMVPVSLPGADRWSFLHASHLEFTEEKSSNENEDYFALVF